MVIMLTPEDVTGPIEVKFWLDMVSAVDATLSGDVEGCTVVRWVEEEL